MEKWIPGIGTLKNAGDFIPLEVSDGGPFKVGEDGVKEILGTKDGKTEFAVYQDKTLCYVKSLMGYPAIYPMMEPVFEGPAEALLMDLDGTSVRSEQFWMWIIEKTMQRLMGNASFGYRMRMSPLYQDIQYRNIYSIVLQSIVQTRR